MKYQNLKYIPPFFQDENDEDYEPARLEYFNSRRSWETGEPPRRAIQIKDAFAITRKKDTRESIHKYVIAIYLVEDCLGIVFDTEQEMNTWLEMLNSCHMGGRSIGIVLTYYTLQK